MKLKHTRLITGLMVAVMLVGEVAPCYAYAADANSSEVLGESMQADASGNAVTTDEISDISAWDHETMEEVYSGEGYIATFKLSSVWDTGYNAEVTIKNESDSDIRNWYLAWNYEDDITNIWNASIYEHEDDRYIIKNAGWNKTIRAGRSISFGLSGSQEFQGFPTNVDVISSYSETDADDFSVEYSVDPDWNSGFKGLITITNKTDKTIEDWVIEFDYAREIASIWDGRIESHDGTHYIVRNAEYNSDIVAGQSVSFGFIGEGGSSSDMPENYVLYSYNLNTEATVKFDVCADDVSNAPADQKVLVGDRVEKPVNPTRDGYYFVGWHTDASYNSIFDFENTRIRRNTTLYARWLDYRCKTDSDQDGIVDSLEEYFGTDINDGDTDKDGLSDYAEVYITGTHPLVVDSDDNGINDPDEDPDEDGIIDIDEVRYGTNPFTEDSDCDDITDLDEITKHNTDPSVRDTDLDNAPDGWEIDNGYDPLAFDRSFSISASLGVISEANPVVASVNVETAGADVESLAIDKVKPHDNYLITPSIAGYLGDAYSFTIDGGLKQAELIFEYDVNLGTIGEDFQPRIYYLNETTGMLEELDNQTVTPGRVTAPTTHFSTYLLLNKVAFDKAWMASSGITSGLALGQSNGTSASSRVIEEGGNPVKSYNGHDYAAIEKALTFSEAKKYCEEQNGYLVSITSAEEQMFIINEVLSGYDYSYWIGGYIDGDLDHYTEVKSLDCYQWCSGEAWEYENWAWGEPNYPDELATIIYDWHESVDNKTSPNDFGRRGKWNNTIAYQKYWFICEWDNGSAVSDYDSNGDGISDYYTSLIKDGTLKLSNASDELKGIDLNYDENGNLTDDCDGDGLKNGEEIKVVEKYGKVYIEMKSHPLRKYSDMDAWDDYEEVQRGSNPLICDFDRFQVDALTNNWNFCYEDVASDLRDDDFVRGMINYSSIINEVWNVREIYRDQIIDYYTKTITDDYVNEVAFEEEKKVWYDALYTWLKNGKDSYDTVYNINKLISYSNGARNKKQVEDSFEMAIAEFVYKQNRISEDAIELRAEVHGNSYIKKYLDKSDIITGSKVARKWFDKFSDGMSVLSYGVDIFDTVMSIGRIQADERIFEENMDILNDLSLFGSCFSIRAAANDVKECLADNYFAVKGKAVAFDASEGVVDAALYMYLPKLAEWGIVAIVSLAVRDVSNLLINTKEDLVQMYRINCFSEMNAMYCKRLSWILTLEYNNKFYTCYYTKNDEAVRYIMNIAKIRIIGEHEYYLYIMNDGLLGDIINEFEGLKDVKKMVNAQIAAVVSLTEKMRIEL
ncbi:MAG: cellulose binding domain-containing protein [Lachnospiraceae bacterium]|nr:cellulose binding domain-containing protein [Lachnospiraceae bacterium]